MKLLEKYLNMDAVSQMLFIAWLTYTLARPKLSTSKYVILILNGGQGTGKTALCNNILLPLIDPNRIGVQVMPKSEKDLAIAAQNAHVLCYDNVRSITQAMSDLLCVAATGGSICSRQLYTDAEQSVLHLHVALVLNGIHSFIEQQDLAQRCLPIELLPFNEKKRKSEAVLTKEFSEDLPAIQGGLFELIAEVFRYLPEADITNPERMIDFVQWLSAMERVHGAPLGIYQEQYSNAIKQGQLDSLLDNLLAAAVLEFAEDHIGGVWTGTPATLLTELNAIANTGVQRSREWPPNPIALSKRLTPLQAGLLTQGIQIEFTRGKHRNITITNLGAFS